VTNNTFLLFAEHGNGGTFCFVATFITLAITISITVTVTVTIAVPITITIAVAIATTMLQCPSVTNMRGNPSI
jgi:hypothetical protein